MEHKKAKITIELPGGLTKTFTTNALLVIGKEDEDIDTQHFTSLAHINGPTIDTVRLIAALDTTREKLINSSPYLKIFGEKIVSDFKKASSIDTIIDNRGGGSTKN